MHPFRRCLVLLAAIATLGILVPGCGPKHPETIPVTGTVTLDGQPVAGAAVVFTPESGEQATATTDGSGRFELSTFELADGAVPGNHRVTVAKTQVEPGEEEKVVFVVPREYGNAATSPLECEVRPEMAPVPLELKSTEAPAPASEATPAAETAKTPAGEENPATDQGGADKPTTDSPAKAPEKGKPAGGEQGTSAAEPNPAAKGSSAEPPTVKSPGATVP